MRTNGFEKPFSKDQVTSWFIQLILIGVRNFITFVATLLDRDKCLAILIPNAVLVIIIIISWRICESRDPSKPSRYCGLCFKNSPGLDHHCTWLNTCIAESNYEAFYCLVVSATCQTLLQSALGIIMCTLWEAEVRANAVDGWETAVIALLWIHNAACLSLTNSFVLLAGFHTYLLYVGMGTYDFILANGSEGLCTRMLKCNCLRRKKKVKRNRSHVQDGNLNDSKGNKAVATRTRRGSPPASIVPASLAPSSIRLQTSLEHAAAAAVLEQSKHSGSSQDVRDSSSNSTTAAMQSDKVLTVRVNESEGIFDDNLSSPPKLKILSGTAVTPTTE
ncbi:hypothetical protein PHMEG_0001912 [Phytophthora megakarya]|uniref:Palmitoyltransferase n=1 Tax=Phytophthora megakarya TaxID=4795 RepID=A0A225X1Z1_9STRA|nr:hypothetical protein PHMEG_0001912 [Phytophthora megakarya]